MARVATLTGPYELHPGRPHADRAQPAGRRRCSAPATPISSRRRPARPTWCICAAGRCGTAAAARWAARRRFSRWCGATTDGCGRRTATGFRDSKSPAPDAAAHRSRRARRASDFDGRSCRIEFQWLRSPWPDELFSLTARPGILRLYGRETIGSLFRQALVARRQQSHCYSAARSSSSSPSTSSRWPASSAITTAPSSITSTSRTTRRSASTCA